MNSFQGQASVLFGFLFLINKYYLFQVGAHEPENLEGLDEMSIPERWLSIVRNKISATEHYLNYHKSYFD